jgi:hypothetical protein
MALKRKGRPVGSLYALQAAVEQGAVRCPECWWQRIFIDGKTMILACNKHSTGIDFDDRMIGAVMTDFHLFRFRPAGESKQLMTKADSEYRQSDIDQRRNSLNRIVAGLEAEPPPVFVERIDVEVINVEVFVTDGQGRPVTGLTREDFEILHDGKPVPISNFFTVSRRDRVAHELEGGAPPAAGSGSMTAPADLPEDQQLNLLVYVDHFNLRPQNRTRVLGTLGGFLEDRMFQGDRVMIVGYDILHIRQLLLPVAGAAGDRRTQIPGEPGADVVGDSLVAGGAHDATVHHPRLARLHRRVPQGHRAARRPGVARWRPR